MFLLFSLLNHICFRTKLLCKNLFYFIRLNNIHVLNAYIVLRNNKRVKPITPIPIISTFSSCRGFSFNTPLAASHERIDNKSNFRLYRTRHSNYFMRLNYPYRFMSIKETTLSPTFTCVT